MYQLFGEIVDCHFPLPGIPTVNSAQADIVVRLVEGGLDKSGFEFFHSWVELNGEAALSCARSVQNDTEARYILRFPGLADFCLSHSLIICDPEPQCRQETLCHLLVDQVLPRLWAHRGNLVLHASAVRLPRGETVAFTGNSGWGKSTLASALCGLGAAPLSDDCIGIQARDGRVRMIPNSRSFRLLEDSILELGLSDQQWSPVCQYSCKTQLHTGLPATGSHVLDRLYIMDSPSHSEEITVRRLHGVGLLATLIKNSFLLDVRDKNSAARQLQEAGAVLDLLPHVYGLAFPRDYNQLASVCEELMVRHPA